MKITFSAPVKFKDNEILDLELNLDKLTGQDLIDVESTFAAKGQTVQMFSQKYFAAIAAKAAGLPVEVINSLPIKDFMKLTNQVIFFLNDTVSETSQQENSNL